MRVAYFRPEATNTHAAALRAFGGSETYVACDTISQVFTQVESGAVDHGVVPIENSTEGVVRETVDCLITKAPMIERELELDIVHELMGPPGLVLEAAKRVISHPQPLAQCRKWLDKNCAHLERQAAASTAAAAKLAAASKDTVALATHLAAERYGLVVLASKIADSSHNATRFICISTTDGAPTGQDRTSFVFTTPHERGALLRALAVLDAAGVNMTRIESRPLPDRRWEYAFVVDVAGHRTDSAVAQALEALRAAGQLVKVIGSYPRSA